MERLIRLSDGQWSRISPLLPPEMRTGGRNAKPHRPMVEAMLWILRTGAPWRDLPSAHGSWKSVYTRLSRWSQSGVLAGLFEALARERDDEGYLIDATIVRAHQDASGAARKGGATDRAFARRSVVGDRAYDAKPLVDGLESRGCTMVIPSNSTRSGQRDYDRSLYRERALVENFFQRIKRLRRIAMRYEKLARNYMAFLHLASVLVWLL